MRILHTSDWHLGRGLHGFMLYDAQESAVNFIVDFAIENQVGLVIIAGDVYDRQVPPTESIQLLNSALTRLDDAGIAVLITAGNHDGAERLAANSNLLKSNVRIAGSLEDITKPLVLSDEHGKLLIYPITYLHPEIASAGLASEGQEPIKRSHAEVMANAMERVRRDLTERELAEGVRLRTIVAAHAFVGSKLAVTKRVETKAGLEDNGQQVSESERDLSIGGIQIVPADVFEGISYVALGHLHGSQVVQPTKGKNVKLRYSGSPIKYSMSERNHKKSFVVIEFGKDFVLPDEAITTHLIPQVRDLYRISGSMDDLWKTDFDKYVEHFVEVLVTYDEYPQGAYARLKSRFPYMVAWDAKANSKVGKTSSEVAVDARKTEPMEVLGSFYLAAYGRELTEAEVRIIRTSFEAVRDASERYSP